MTHCQPSQRGTILGIPLWGCDFLPPTSREVLGGTVGIYVDNPLLPTETCGFLRDFTYVP